VMIDLNRDLHIPLLSCIKTIFILECKSLLIL
jgi:hypothetical protein